MPCLSCKIPPGLGLEALTAPGIQVHTFRWNSPSPFSSSMRHPMVIIPCNRPLIDHQLIIINHRHHHHHHRHNPWLLATFNYHPNAMIKRQEPSHQNSQNISTHLNNKKHMHTLTRTYFAFSLLSNTNQSWHTWYGGGAPQSWQVWHPKFPSSTRAAAVATSRPAGVPSSLA